jgi:ACDE family multidrug resistance protein
VRAQTRVRFAALASVPFVMVLSNSMIIPVLPAIQQALDKSLFQIGLLITAFSLAAGVVIPVGGYLSDRFGRRRVMIPCLVLFGLGGLVCGLAPLVLPGPSAVYAGLLVGRLIQGVGAGGTYQVAMALAGDIFHSRERSKVLGLLEASNGLGKVASPIVGAAVMVLAWYAPFFVYPLLAWLAAAAVWLVVREPEGNTTDRPLTSFAQGLARVFSRKGGSLLACFLAGALALFFLFGVLSYYSDVLEQRHHIGGVLRGLIIAVPVAVMALTSYLSGTLLVRHLTRLSKLLVVVGLGLVVASFVAMFFLSWHTLLFTAAISVMGLGNGLLLPSVNTMITSATASSERGTLTALYGTVRFLGAGFGPPAFDRAVQTGAALPYLGSAALALLALLLAVLAIDQRQMLGGLPGGTPQRPGKVVRLEHAPPGRQGDRLT